ncbi:MAG: ATP-binding cassette domain-containing protein [Sciscionella sp.]|nr:ATP-binding cassette domain-containing protein [Sciscionella sp.]
MALAVLIGVAVGVLTYQRRIPAALATTTAAAVLTIPSIALLGIMIGPFGLGTTNVLIALVLYALLPITRNTIVGLRGVDRAVVDAAIGMGLSRSRLLWRVRLPLAWPVILSGIRVSTQMTIGIAAIGAYVKGPGLGNEIFDGLGRFGSVNSLNQVLIGTIGIVVLALLFDLAFVVVRALTTPRDSSTAGQARSIAAATTTPTEPGRPGQAIELAEVSKHYPGQSAPAVDNLSMRIPAGQIVVLVGPSGCGKTTTMKMINRLIDPTSGRVRLGDVDVSTVNPTRHRRGIGYVIQQIGLFPHLRVADNIGVVPRLLRWSKARTSARAIELLDVIGLSDGYARRYPKQLSGGQQQRVGVARALAADPPVMLMDEPFGATDPITRARLQDEFLRLQRELGKTIVFVTHDFDEAVKLGDKIAVLRPRSVIAQYDTPERILAAPTDDYVADFIGSGRQLRRLGLIRLADVPLTDVPATANGLPTVPRAATVRDALNVMVREGSETVLVNDDDSGGAIGALRLSDVVDVLGPDTDDASAAEPTPEETAEETPTASTTSAARTTATATASASATASKPTSAAVTLGRRLRERWRGLVVRPIVLLVVLLTLYFAVHAHRADDIERRYLNGHEIGSELLQHIALSVVSTVCTIAIAVPLGVLLTRQAARAIRPIGLALGNLGQAIPSIGLVVLLALWINTGFSTALIALIVYSVLPVLRNTIVGLQGVDPTLTEAARGMGMSRFAVLARIELPLAVPVILAGIRTALVLTVSSATLATFIDGGGLGGGLVAGIGLYRPILSLSYGIIVAATALFADWLGLLAEELLRPKGM